MPRAELILREKIIDEAGNLVELVIWAVPWGVRYRLAFIRYGDSVPIVLYDNHHPKGPHRHVEGVEESYPYTDLDRLLADFRADVSRIRGDGG
jgi:Family of unknown function (DUF6516)